MKVEMKLLLAPVIALCVITVSAADDKTPRTVPGDEQLTYTINWPTGLSLGEAHLTTHRAKADNGAIRYETEFNIDASVPGFSVLDRFRSVADSDLCSVEFEKHYVHGKRRTDETTRFDQQKGSAVRETKGGGKSDISIPGCAKDALAYVQYLRRELSQGRLPPHQDVYFGGAYKISVQFTGTQNITVSDKRTEADRLVVTLKGPQTDSTFEVFFAKDATRTPVLVKVPLSLATFSMELVR